MADFWAGLGVHDTVWFAPKRTIPINSSLALSPAAGDADALARAGGSNS